MSAIALACVSSDLVRNVSANDFAFVREGRYKGNVRVVNDDPQLKQTAQGWRTRIEADPAFLLGIADRFFSLPDTTRFQFKYVGRDSSARRTILRYFAPAARPFIIAGWQVQFVFDLSSPSLKAVYAEEVPLE